MIVRKNSYNHKDCFYNNMNVDMSLLYERQTRDYIIRNIRRYNYRQLLNCQSNEWFGVGHHLSEFYCAISKHQSILWTDCDCNQFRTNGILKFSIRSVLVRMIGCLENLTFDGIEHET